MARAPAAVVLAAGKGVRMNSQTPKVLHQVCGVPMVRLVADAAGDAGLAPVVVVVPPASGAIAGAVGDAVACVEQAQPLGSGHALLQAREAVADGDPVVVLCADVPLVRPETLLRLVRLHAESGSCLTLLTSHHVRPEGLGRVARDAAGRVRAVVEERDADAATRATTEVNAGVYCFQAAWLWENLPMVTPSPSGEVYLTSLVERAHAQGRLVVTLATDDPTEGIGINNRVQLAEVEAALRRRIRERWMLAGVTMPDPSTVYIDAGVRVGEDTVLLPNTHLTGQSRIGRLCRVGPNSVISDSSVGDGCRVVSSVVEGSVLDERVTVGPFSHVRPGSRLERDVHLGNFAEVKGTRLGAGTRSAHFSYLGDADVGANVNIGAGTVTCNYDGVSKHPTVIGEGAFIGSDSMLVAPVKVGAGASTGAGSVVTRDVPAHTLAAGVPARVIQKKTGAP